MSAVPKPFITPEEYLRRERLVESKHEYHNGQIFAMAGVSPKHVVINSHLSYALHKSLHGGPCLPLPGDLRVKVSPTGLYTYPDHLIVCGEMELEDEDTLLNPKVIFEILSPSTERYDRGNKFDHYKSIASLQEYILISQLRPRVEQFVRQPDNRWILTTYDSLESTLKLEAVSATVPLTELYENITFARLTIYDEPIDNALTSPPAG
jgi:Uma2 family endonuclease